MKTLIAIILITLFIWQCQPVQKTGIILNDNAAERLADNFIKLFPDSIHYPLSKKKFKWDYEQGLVLEAFYRLWKMTGNQKYFDYIKRNINYFIESDGSIRTYKFKDYNIDNIAPGRQLLHLYAETNQDKYKTSADILRKQLAEQPRTSEGGFWHKKKYPYQMWLDGLYMGAPFYTEYAVLFNEDDAFDDISNQFLLIRKNNFDANTGLYFHGWDESREQAWSDSIKGTSSHFWGRALGWFMMALVDVLDSFPENHPHRNDLIEMFKNLSASLLQYKDSNTKLWYQIVDLGHREGNYIETSSSLMYIYSFAKGVNKGYLDNEYINVATESYKSVLANFLSEDQNGVFSLNNVVSVGGLGGKPYRDGSFEYYMSEPVRLNDFKGYGSLLLAAIELSMDK